MKGFSTLLLLFISIVSLNAQVGINTATPDPSSMLDISSTEAGILTPRMTTVQRELISSPAQGLLVYDTDEESFYFFDTIWMPLNSSVKRDNYKLVKDTSDLAAELSAGGGSQYLLNTNFLYEINGTIVFDFPINLNSAYIEGVDSSEDILVNNSGGALFQGAAGGSIRNITLSGNGRPIFNLNGSGSELLVINNTVIAGANSVGSINSMGTVFFSITQFVGNANGFTLSNLGTFLMSNMFWTASNSGTFIDATGTFNNFQMGNGRVETDSGEIGIDVSSNPTIANEAVLSEISFVGNGTRIAGYTVGSYSGFNFTSNWSVRCGGIPEETDESAAGNFYETSALSSGFSQEITNNTAVEIQGNGSFTTSSLFRYRVEGGGNRIIYEGKSDRSVQVNVSLSVRVVGAATDFYTFVIAKNGAVVTETNSVVRIDSNAQIQNVALNGILSMSNEDYIEVYVQRLTNAGADNDTLVIFSENFSVR